MSQLRPFHLAMPVNDLAKARKFYAEVLGCSEGRSSAQWVDFNFFGHQFVCHLKEQVGSVDPKCNRVDGDAVPVPHFGVILDMTDWKNLRDRLQAAQTDFIVKPRIRFAGAPGEQATMFFTDPSGNALEFKAFSSDERIFET